MPYFISLFFRVYLLLIFACIRYTEGFIKYCQKGFVLHENFDFNIAHTVNTLSQTVQQIPTCTQTGCVAAPCEFEP